MSGDKTVKLCHETRRKSASKHQHARSTDKVHLVAYGSGWEKGSQHFLGLRSGVIVRGRECS